MSAAMATAIRTRASSPRGIHLASRGPRGGRVARGTACASSSSSYSADGVVVDTTTRHPAVKTRRAALAHQLLLAAGAPACASLAVPASALAATMPDSEPTGLDARGRLFRCPSTFNCVSTSSIGGAPEQFATAWTAPTTTLNDAVNQISAAVFRACPEARKMESFETPTGDRYLRFETRGKFGPDDVEFLIRAETLGDRNWEGDAGKEKNWLVTYRSLATTVKYVYPFTTPLSDFGEQKKRMERIRREVEWRRVGCEVEEVCGNEFN